MVQVVRVHKEQLSRQVKSMPGRAILAIIHTHRRSVADFCRSFNVQRQSVYTWLDEGSIPLETVAPYFAHIFNVDTELLSYVHFSIAFQGEIQDYKSIVLENKKVFGGYLDYVLEGREPDPMKIWNFYLKSASKKYVG